MRALLGLGALLLVLSGCATPKALMPAGENIPLRDADLDELLELLDERYEDLSALKALVDVEVQGPSGRGEFAGALFFRRPDQLRLRGLDLLGRTLFDLSARHEDVKLYVPAEDRLLTDRADLSSVLGLGADGFSLGLTDLLEVLGAGSGVYLDAAYMPALEKGEREYVLYLFFPQGSRAFLFKKLWLERRHFRLVREEIFDPTGQKRLTLSFEDYQEVEGLWRPLRVRAETWEGARVAVVYRELRINPSLAPEDFILEAERR